MFYVATFFWCIPGAVIWVFNAEAWTVGYAIAGVEHLWLLVSCVTLGQTVGFSAMFFFGAWLISKWPRLQGRLEKIDLSRYKKSAYATLSLSSFSGFPPHALLAALARPAGVHYVGFLLITLIGRAGRFTILALAPQTFRDLLGL